MVSEQTQGRFRFCEDVTNLTRNFTVTGRARSLIVTMSNKTRILQATTVSVNVNYLALSMLLLN